MKTVNVEPNQTLFDLALQYYGTVEALHEILSNNPDLENDPAALIALGVDMLQRGVFRLDVAVRPGFRLKIDETSKLIEDNVLKKITNSITTYETWQELSPKSRRQ